MRIGIKPGQWGWSFEELESSWRAAEEAGFDLLSCFDHVSAGPQGLRAWDAPSLLVAMAGHTERIRLSVHVLNASFRNPLLLAGQLAVAQAMSRGRLEVGLGAGSFHLARFDHRVAGVAFPRFAERMDRLEACCRALPALWRGDRVDEPVLGLRGASLGPVGISPPPITVGGGSEAALDIAARYADAWNASSRSREGFADLCQSLDQRCRALGREPIAKEAQFFLRDVGLDRLRETANSLAEAGAQSVIVVLNEERGPDWVRRVADALL